MFKNSSGDRILLQDTPFAQGGEGKLFKITAPARYASTHLVKIYHSHKLTPERQNKLKYLIENPPTKLAGKKDSTVVWPESLLYNEQDELLGFIMRMIKGEKLELLTRNKLPKGMEKIWWRFDLRHSDSWALRFKLAYNLSIAISHIHQSDEYVLVDLKPDNVIVQPDGLLYLVDIDSIEVVDEQGQTLFDAPVATPEYTPPENYRELDYDPTSRQSWDNFSLGVILYKLFLGIHPFAATSHAPYDERTTLVQKIEAGLFVYAESKKDTFSIIPDPHQAFKLLPSNIQSLFKKCFDAGHLHPEQRPLAKTWTKAFRICIENPIQYRITEISGFTNQDNRFGALLLPSLKSKINAYQAILDRKREGFELSPAIQQGISPAHSIDLKKIEKKTFSKKGIPVIIIIIGICLLFSFYTSLLYAEGDFQSRLAPFIIVFLIFFLISLFVSYYIFSKSKKISTKQKVNRRLVAEQQELSRRKKELNRIILGLNSSLLYFSHKEYQEVIHDTILEIEKQFVPLEEQLRQFNEQLLREFHQIQLQFVAKLRVNEHFKDIPGKSFQEIKVFLERMGKKVTNQHITHFKTLVEEYQLALEDKRRSYEDEYSKLRYKGNKRAEALYKDVRKAELQWKAALKEVLGDYTLSEVEQQLQQYNSLQREVLNLAYLQADYKTITFRDYLFRNG